MPLRSIEKKDVSKCLEIYNYYIENTCHTLEEDKLKLEDFKKRCEDICEKFPFIVLESDNGKVVGYAYLSTFHPRSAYRATADLSIYVDKDCLHNHAGEKLLKEIENRARERGITNLISIVTDENVNSLNFHLKNGFVLEGTIHDVAVKFGKVLGVYYLRKPLIWRFKDVNFTDKERGGREDLVRLAFLQPELTPDYIV